MSINLADIQRALADAMFSGDTSLAGMAIFSGIMVVMFAAFAKKNILVPFAAMLPLSVMFSSMNILPSALAILLSLISVVVIATKAREAL